MCIVTPGKKLLLEAPEFVPASVKHYVQPDNVPNFSFNLSTEDFDTDDDKHGNICEKSHVCFDRDSLCFDSESEFGLCTNYTKPCT